MAINYYSVLGVQRTDSEGTIRKAYRNLAKKYHPDLNPGDTAAEKRMREIGEAWEVLGDAEKRKKYDSELDGGPKKAPFTAGPSKTPQPNRPITQEDFFNMSRGFDNMFSPDAIKNSANRKQSSRQNPIDTTGFFEQVMGFKGPKKK